MITTLTRAAELPAEWDDVVGDNLYLRRDFLAFMESCEDCTQRYHLVRDDEGRLDTVYLTYVRPRYNLAMFTGRRYEVTMTFVYVPLSVTRPGIAWGSRRDEALAAIREIKGYTLMLNLPPGDYPGFATGLTCPKCILTLEWPTFDAYLSSLRSHYRHRYTKALRQSGSLRWRFLEDNAEFDESLYALYGQVYEHSALKIEKLPLEFFQGPYFRILVASDDTGPVGFVQFLPNGDELIFEFVGFDYATNRTYDTYQRLLLEIVRYGIEHGFRTVDLGQTADDTKLKLGSRYEMLYAALHHSNPVLHQISRLLAPKLQYRPVTTDFRVFRDEDETQVLSPSAQVLSPTAQVLSPSTQVLSPSSDDGEAA
jgi:Acetyltransferase (GNAT) domain